MTDETMTAAADTAAEPSAPTLDQSMEATYDRLQEADAAERAPAPAAEPEAPARKPPQAWAEAAKAKFAALDPELQEQILKREADVAKGFEARAAELRPYRELDAVLAPRREALRRGWGSEAAGLDYLLQMSDLAGRDPAAFVAQFARQSGVDLAKLAAAPAAAPDPGELRQRLTQLEARLQSQDAAQLRGVLAKIATEVDGFERAQDEKGQPLRPHLDAVREDMARLLTAGLADDLSDAYEKAIWSSPELRGRLLEERRLAEEASRRQEASRARRSAGTNLSGRGHVQGGPTKARTWEETMAAAYDRITNAG